MSLTSKEFKERSSVNVLVPQATDLDLEELFANNEKQDGLNQLFTIEQRSHLFFGGHSWQPHTLLGLTHSQVRDR